MMLPVVRGTGPTQDPLKINAPLVRDWLVKFLRDEVIRRRRIEKAVLGLSGGVDSAVVAYLCAEAFGPENVLAVRLPYKISSSESLSHAQMVVDDIGIRQTTVDITAMVDGYLGQVGEASGQRVGNVCARCRMIALFDLSMAEGALPIGTGNKTERFFGYFTWHGDDAPPINPLGDLYKTQVWQLARELGVPESIVAKPPTADLVKGQTDEGDLGISYPDADAILHYVARGFGKDTLLDLGFDPAKVDLVLRKVGSTHWKRRGPTVAMMSNSAIGEYYLRPVDY